MHGSEFISRMQHTLLNAYNKIWSECSDVDKFILYDFALYGFTNYKQTDMLFALYNKGLLAKKAKDYRL
jgi:hypothetical protein